MMSVDGLKRAKSCLAWFHILWACIHQSLSRKSDLYVSLKKKWRIEITECYVSSTYLLRRPRDRMFTTSGIGTVWLLCCETVGWAEGMASGLWKSPRVGILMVDRLQSCPHESRSLRHQHRIHHSRCIKIQNGSTFSTGIPRLALNTIVIVSRM